MREVEEPYCYGLGVDVESEDGDVYDQIDFGVIVLLFVYHQQLTGYTRRKLLFI